MKKKGIAYFFVGIIAICSVAISAVSFSFAWFKGLGDKIKDENLPGEIGLRGYFYAGSGQSIEDPYEIVSPIHFYNLSRLQNYGIFSEKTYFRIGHDFGTGDGYQCIDYKTGAYTDELEMKDFLQDNPQIVIRPIGSESTPFHGHFEGNGIPIRNLMVSGYPEDIGIFGYVAHDGEIEGLVCDTLTVESLGYTTITSDDTFKLFSQNIENLFASSSYLATETNLDFYNYQSTGVDTYGYVRALPVPAKPGLKNENGLGGVEYKKINANMYENTNYYRGYFIPTFPNRPASPYCNTNNHPNDPFSYSWSSSSSIITVTDALNVDVNGDSVADDLIVFDFTKLKLNGQDQFNTGDDMQLDVRLNLIASVEVEGIIYSRVIQSYLIEFYSNQKRFEDPVTDNNGWTVHIYCNYATPDDIIHPATNYYHGNNIGFLVGHLDGTLTHSYVYNGTFKFNDDSYNPIKAETQTGLVGEVGTNVVNALDPDYNSVVHGETGAMNFTRIYDGIRGDFSGGESIHVGLESSKKIASYDTVINHTGDHNPDDSLFDNYSEYLRHRPTGEYITGIFENPTGSGSWSTWDTANVPTPPTESFNTVDFLFNNVIQDDRDAFGKVTTNRGLGIFKLVTPRNTSANSGNYQFHVLDNLGECRIIKGNSYDKVYFSTAEYKHLEHNYLEWGDTAESQPLRATTLPTNSNVFTFDYPFSRDHNYVFELDLTQNVEDSTNNFMYDTNSQFLSNYLQSILIDKYGRTIPHGDYRFGFMLQNSELNRSTGQEETIPFQSLSSYMPIRYPGGDGSLTNYGGDAIYKGTLDSESDISSIVSPSNLDCYYVNNSSVYYQWNSTKGNWDISVNNPGGNYIKEVDYYTDLATEEPTNGDCYLVHGYPSYFKYNGSTWVQTLDSPLAVFYPANSIVFDITNDNGGNVSVIANKKNVSIYKFYKYKTASKPTPDKAVKMFTMKSENVADPAIDTHRYFKYDYSDGYGTTSTLAYENDHNLMKDDGVLYAHTFKLDKLDDGWAYAIGCSDTGNDVTSNLYYLAVQGQVDGNIGSKAAKVGNVLNDVDFLTQQPRASDYVVETTINDNGTPEDPSDDTETKTVTYNSSKVAKLSFTSDFNTRNGSFTVGAVTDGVSGHNYINFEYNNSPKFITYLFAYDYKSTPGFFLNDSKYPTNISPTYTIIKRT